jgi:hypothetical protein
MTPGKPIGESGVRGPAQAEPAPLMGRASALTSGYQFADVNLTIWQRR